MCACVDALNIEIINSIIKSIKREWINEFRRIAWVLFNFSLLSLFSFCWRFVFCGLSLLPHIYLAVWYNRFNCVWLLYLWLKANAYFHFYYNHAAMDFQLHRCIRTMEYMFTFTWFNVHCNAVGDFDYLIDCHFTHTPFLVITFETNKMAIKHWTERVKHLNSHKAMNQRTTSRSFLCAIEKRKEKKKVPNKPNKQQTRVWTHYITRVSNARFCFDWK